MSFSTHLPLEPTNMYILFHNSLIKTYKKAYIFLNKSRNIVLLKQFVYFVHLSLHLSGCGYRGPQCTAVQSLTDIETSIGDALH